MSIVTYNQRGLKQTIVQVPDTWRTPGGDVSSSRDRNKLFLITEWPAVRAERWAWRFGLCVTRSRAEIPLAAGGLTWQQIAIIGYNTLLRGEIRADELLPILDELLDCVTVIADPKARTPAGEPISAPLMPEEDLREIQTVGWLRDEVVRLHSTFSVADAVSALGSSISSASASQPGSEPSSGTT